MSARRRRLLAIAFVAVVPFVTAAECDVSVAPTNSPPTLRWEVREAGKTYTYGNGDTHYASPEARLSVTLHVEDPAGIRSVLFHGSQTGRCRDYFGHVDRTYSDQRLDFTKDAADGTAPGKWTAGFQAISGTCPAGGPASVNAQLKGYASNFSGLDRNSTVDIRIPLPPITID